ncbi:MAG: IS481 family transposase [Myxococcota bacterium]|nr:IS481 family transposase [Myxococcota bacterium]
MHLHPNAKLTPRARQLLVDRVERSDWSVARAARAAGVSRQTAYKWLNRFKEAGEAGLRDRSSRPRRITVQTPRKLVRRMVQLRRRRKAGWEIAQELEVPVSTVSKHLKAQGLGRIWRLEESLDPPQRYEHPVPGDLLHIDAKRFARIEAVGHRIHGDRSQKKRGVGYEVVFVCVDDHTRLAYAEVQPSENARYATAFLRRALKWFRSLGIRARRVLSDNAKCYGSKAFTALCEAEGIRQSFTRPYTPKTNGKAERFIQTLKRRWAYRYVFRTSAIRAASLRPWVTHYNHKRPHRALGKKPPMARLREARQQPA